MYKQCSSEELTEDVGMIVSFFRWGTRLGSQVMIYVRYTAEDIISVA